MNVYIWKEYNWQPGANTVLYYPLDSINTVNDLSGNNYNLTKNGTVTFGTYQGVDCAYFDGGNFTCTAASLPQGNSSRTLSVWLYITKNDGGIFCYGQISNYKKFGIYAGSATQGIVGTVYMGTDVESGTVSYNTWLHCAVVATSTTWEIYINGIKKVTQSKSDMSTNGTNITIGNLDRASTYTFKSYMSNMILEDKARTSQEVSDYFNQTKSLYGIS